MARKFRGARRNSAQVRKLAGVQRGRRNSLADKQLLERLRGKLRAEKSPGLRNLARGRAGRKPRRKLCLAAKGCPE